MKRACVASLMLCALVVAALAAQSGMRAGRWEVTTQMQMPGMQMPDMKSMQCVTAEQLKDPASALPGAPSGPGDKPACKVSDYKASGNTVSWKVACTAPQTMTGSGEILFSGDSYTGAMKMTSPQGEMTLKLAGKRVGDCP